MDDIGISKAQLNTTELKPFTDLLSFKKSEPCKAQALENNHGLEELVLAATIPLAMINLMKTLACFRQLSLGRLPTTISHQILNM